MGDRAAFADDEGVYTVSGQLDARELQFLIALTEEHIASPAAKRVPSSWLTMWRSALVKLQAQLKESTDDRL